MPHSIYPFICWWHLGWSHFLAVVNNTAMNIGAQVSESLLSISVLLIIYLQVKLLGQMVILCLVFEEPPNCFPQYLHHFPFPPEMCEGSNFCIPLLTLVIFH